MLILACISGHGFGHGSRSAAVLTALHQLRPDWRLVLSTSLPESFLTMALGPVPFERRHCQWDVGVVQADALGADPAATLLALEVLEQQLPGQLEREVDWLLSQAEPILVMADVPPAAALLAQRLGAPLVWLANFGWDGIYGAMGPHFAGWADGALALYRQGQLLLQAPLAMPMPWGLPTLSLGLTAGTPRLEASALATQLGLPADPARCVLISFGGLGMALRPELLDLWPGHTFISTDPLVASRANGRLLPPGIRPLEVMGLCERVITKPGYSSFCEALSQGVGIHLVHRSGFAEAGVLEEALQRHGRHRLLSQEQWHRGDWQLDRPLLAASRDPLPSDGCEQAAQAIIQVALG
ncbi:hypothetical protein KBY58_03175 [Cyanobium sp. HWJ4-Hawea]|uniref:hypothetical protein n=1 Tax=Cyanobium sp. HWJ4-Hawea TaxID=2823713 RepID=UPI0020CECE4A|nr:hypothetical protein [Cyanobium sp. HWJ4-Hawea]MCP9808434.1 hypothetical protein [Cyanobium sp. HWJ4-Hawea]